MASENPYPTTYRATSVPDGSLDTPEGFADLDLEDYILQVQEDVATLAAEGFLEVTVAEDGALAYRFTEWGLALLT